jgi:hypothetical protein
MKLILWKKLGLAFTIAIVFLFSAILLLPRVVDLNRYNSRIVAEIEKALGGNVQIGGISWGIIGNLDLRDIYVELDGFSIEGASAFKGDAQLKSAYAEISILRLITKKIAAKTLRLESPVSVFRLAPKPSTGKEVDVKMTVKLHFGNVGAVSY